MALFLSILKIIGIALLVILGVLLLVLLLVLFVPVRYKVDAVVEETDLLKDKDKLKDNITASASFSWLLHFISGGIAYPENLEFKVKVLCFTLFPSKNKENDDALDFEGEDYEKASGNADNKSEDKTDSKPEDKSEDKTDNKPEDKSKDRPEDDRATEKESGFEDFEAQKENIRNKEKQNESNKEEYDINNIEDDEFESEKESFFDILHKIFLTIIKLIKVPQDVFAKIQYTISGICDKINMIKNTLSNDIFKRAYELTKKHVIRGLKMILPKKFKANILIGLADPTVTADIISGYGMLYPILVNKVFLVPDFERQVIKGDLHIKGKISIFTLVYSAAILYFNKDIKKTIRRFKKILNS